MGNKTANIVVVILLILAAFLLYFAFSSGKRDKPEKMNNSDMIKSEQNYQVQTSDISYFNTTKGYYARPLEPGSYPGVVMIHEWWGLNNNIKDMAKELAAEGYAVLAVDLYNGQVAQNADEARGLIGGLDQEQATLNLQAAADYLRGQNATQIASLGWCFGGGQSMQLALSGEELDATVIYYGNLVTDPSELENIDWPVLGIFGAEDQSIQVETVSEFEETLDQLGVENEIYVYPGVGHAFANPSGDNYAAQETMNAWQKTLAFLQNALAQ